MRLFIGLYLLLMVIGCAYILGGLMMAETNETRVKAYLADDPKLLAAPTPLTGADPSLASTPISTPNPETSSGNTSSSSGSFGPPTVTTQDLPQVTIPADVYINLPYVFTKIISADFYVFLVVCFSGMLGASIRATHAYMLSDDSNESKKETKDENSPTNWSYFVLMPFTGGALSLVIYFVIRGGFYGASFGKGLVLNLFSFCALGALTGLFTNMAIEKLQQIAETLLSRKSNDAKKGE